MTTAAPPARASTQQAARRPQRTRETANAAGQDATHAGDSAQQAVEQPTRRTGIAAAAQFVGSTAQAGAGRAQASFDAVLGAGRGLGTHVSDLVGGDLVNMVKAAASRGALDEVHRLLKDSGVCLLRPLEPLRDALAPFTEHFCALAATAAEQTLWEMLGAIAVRANDLLKTTVSEAFLDKLALVLDAACAPSASALEQLAGEVRSQASAAMLLDAMRSWVGNSRARMCLRGEYEFVRDALGLDDSGALCSVLGLSDAAQLLKVFELAYRRTGNPLDAFDVFERALARALRAYAQRARKDAWRGR